MGSMMTHGPAEPDPLEPPDPDPGVFDVIGDVPPDAEAAMFHYLVPQVQTPADLLRYQAVDSWMRSLRSERLAQNARLMEMERSWLKRKVELKPQLMELVATKKQSTLLGTTYTQARQDSVTWNHENDHDVLEWLEKNHPETELLRDEDVELKVVLTATGRQKLKAALLNDAKQGLDVPACVEFTPAGHNVVTRLRSDAKLTGAQVMELRGAALSALAHDPDQQSQQSQEDQP